jgi:hypothetical protein
MVIYLLARSSPFLPPPRPPFPPRAPFPSLNRENALMTGRHAWVGDMAWVGMPEWGEERDKHRQTNKFCFQFTIDYISYDANEVCFRRHIRFYVKV